MMLATKNNFIEGCGVFFFAIKKLLKRKKCIETIFFFLNFLLCKTHYRENLIKINKNVKLEIILIRFIFEFLSKRFQNSNFYAIYF